MTTTHHFVAFSLLAASLSSQSLAPGHLVGWANNNGPLAVCSSVYTQDIEGSCAKALHRGNSLCTAKTFHSGGTAYDPRVQGAWVSNGTEIALHDLATKKIVCRFSATLGGSGYVVTGLALSDSRRELYQLEMGPNVLAISSYDVSTPCKPVHKKNGCRRRLTGTGASAMGLAYDETRDLLYHVTSLAGVQWINDVHVSRPTAPCTVVQTLSIKYCGSFPGSAATAMGYDPCSRRLYVAFNTEVRKLLLTDPVKGLFTDLTGTGACCKFTGIGIWAGLAVVPSWKKTPVGKSCVHSPCGSCPLKLDTTGGDASLGSRTFGFLVSGAPTASQGLFYVALGKCTTGVSIPSLCGPVYPSLTPPWPLLVGSFTVSGSPGSCNGTARVITGVPADPTLCKSTICAQWLLLCPTGGLWSGLTNGLEFTVGG